MRTSPFLRAGCRILFIEQFYYPDGWGGAQLPLDVTTHLARLGFKVEVICGSDQYAPVEGEPPADPTLEGIRIRRIPALLRGDIHAAKLIRQLWFYLALLPLLFMRRPPHLIVTQTNPPLALVLAAAAARLWRRPMMIIAMDVYPEVLIAHGVMREAGVMGRVMARLFRWAYRSARRVIALGPVMSERLVSKGVDGARIIEIPNWATGELGSIAGAGNSLREEWELQGCFVVLYSGNLGLAHEFDTLLAGVARAHRSMPALRVVIIGRGSRLAAVKRRVGELGIGSIVRFKDLLTAKRLPESFGLAQLALVTLQPGFEGLVVPSKLQGYWARGVPVLYIGPRSDIDQFIERSGGGVALRCGDVDGVAGSISALAADPQRLARLGIQGRQFYELEFARAHGLARYEAAVDDVLLGTSTAP
ncbi:MAG: glycosyltransferase family 4 protein [Steroidobacteraceae bacterium]